MLTASPAEPPPSPLTNLAHIDWLGAEVAPPPQAGHTTYRLAEEPAIGVLWTYADRQADGTYRRIGGGAYDPVTDTWGQGAFNADDISRAAVVYLRHWQADRSGVEPADGLPVAAGADLPADRGRAQCRQRRVVDAARRHAQPERRPGRAPRPVRQRRVVLAGADDLGAR